MTALSSFFPLFVPSLPPPPFEPPSMAMLSIILSPPVDITIPRITPAAGNAVMGLPDSFSKVIEPSVDSISMLVNSKVASPPISMAMKLSSDTSTSQSPSPSKSSIFGNELDQTETSFSTQITFCSVPAPSSNVTIKPPGAAKTEYWIPHGACAQPRLASYGYKFNCIDKYTIFWVNALTTCVTNNNVQPRRRLL